MEDLAYRMFTKGEAQLHFNTLREAIDTYFDPKTRQALELSLDNLDYQIRNCSFLSRNDAQGYYAFAHRSFVEYFVARKLSREILQGKAAEIRITDEIALFVSNLIDPSFYERSEPPSGTKVPENMVYISPGQFIMGQKESIRIANSRKGFFMDKYPVTNAQFCAFLNERDNHPEDNQEWIDLGGFFLHERCRISRGADCFVVAPGFEEHPVIYVSCLGARAYAWWAGKRLPTEEEWERAARGVDGRVYPWGNEFVQNNCNTSESGILQTTPVVKYLENRSPYGCIDMVGNVWEWTDSWYNEKEEQKVLRGSSWSFNQHFASCAFRHGLLPNSSYSSSGFRCAMD